MGLLLGGWVKMLAKGKCMIGKVRIINLYDGLVYIRGVNGEDLSTFIKSVTFTLSFIRLYGVIKYFIL